MARNKWIGRAVLSAIVALAGAAGLASAANSGAPDAGVRLFDTGMPSAEALSPAALAQKSGWTQVPEDQVKHEFAGDAVFLNNRVAVALRRGSRGAELYSAGADGAWKERAVLVPAGPNAANAAATRFASASIVENSPAGVTVEATFQSAGQPLAASYELKMGQLFVKTTPKEGVTAMRVEAPCRFAVLPDFFADDIMLDATELTVSRAELPSENFLLEMLEGNDAVLASVWTEGNDVAVTLAGQAAEKRIADAQIPYGTKGNVWVAVIAAPQVWHVRDIGPRDRNKVLPLDWKPPFPAVWRADWRRIDHLADSWELAVQRPDGSFSKYSWFRDESTIPGDRKRWATVLGYYFYPCWIDQKGQAILQPQNLHDHSRFEGPTLIYPVNRTDDTPLNAFTVVDVVRATLGVGPCEYILDVEGQQSHYNGIATCACQDTLMPIYQEHRQAQRRARIEKALTDVMIFVRYIRSRIEAYVAFSHDMAKYLAEYRQQHPDLAAQVTELERLNSAIDERYEESRETIKTPDEAQKLVDAFREAHLADETPQAVEACQKFTQALVQIGSTQDHLVGHCRQAVKVLRQQAGNAVALDDRMAEVSKEVRQRCHDILRNPASHECAGH